jgi:OOP family OmpA-OmpF porin
MINSKAIFTSLVFIHFCFFSYSQQQKYIHPVILELHYSLSDYKNKAVFSNLKNMYSGLGIGLIKGISTHFDWAVSLNGSFADSVMQKPSYSGNKNLLVETDFTVRARMFGKPTRMQPYLQGGLGFSIFSNNYGGYMPLGVGLEINIFRPVYILINSQYRIPLTSTSNHHFFYSFGIAGNISSKKKNPSSAAKPSLPSPAAIMADRDHDGITDSLDACADIPGLAIFDGCPDRDGDGIPDNKDNCPDTPGVIKYFGCPIPDSDGDGFNDEEDSCVMVPGVAALHGCPIPDRDKDGISDGDDKCPDLPGYVGNNGCPVVQKDIHDLAELAAKNIFFVTGSYTILPKSYSSLDAIVRVLVDDANLKLNIEGHTDNVGSIQSNLILSDNRAKAVKVYLMSKGIDEGRLNAKGYGESNPVAENKTAHGRAKNRRVQFELYF